MDEPTWQEAREAIAQELEAEAARIGGALRQFAAIEPGGPLVKAFASRQHELALAAAIAREWSPRVRRA